MNSRIKNNNHYPPQAWHNEWISFIEDMVDSQEFEWAEDTLLDIGATIEDTEKVTDGQKTAILNIKYGKGNW